MSKLYLGPRVTCACCSKIVPIRLCSVAGPISIRGPVQASHTLLSKLYQDVALRIQPKVRTHSTRDPKDLTMRKRSTIYYRFTCLKCACHASELYWVEASTNNWVGGWCKYCLHRRFEDGTFGHPEDGGDCGLPILRMNASKKVADTLEAWNEAYNLAEKAESEVSPVVSPAEDQLF